METTPKTMRFNWTAITREADAPGKDTGTMALAASVMKNIDSLTRSIIR